MNTLYIVVVTLAIGLVGLCLPAIGISAAHIILHALLESAAALFSVSILCAVACGFMAYKFMCKRLYHGA